ncbi:MAG: ATP-binding protein [Anaerolineales bacterium]
MRLRFILAFILIALVSVGSVLVIARQTMLREVRAYMFRGGMAGVEGLVTGLEDYYLEHRSWVGADQLFAFPGQMSGNRRGNQGNPGGFGGMMGGMMNQRLRLADSQGNLVIDTEPDGIIDSFTATEIQQAIQLQVGNDTVGYLLPAGGMNFNPGDDNELLNRLTRAAYIAAGVAIGFSVVLALILSTRLIKPVRALTQAATSLSEGDLTRRVEVHGEDELAILGQTFNQMAAALENAEETRQAMTADIAHELRTPLAIQRAHVEALQDGVYPVTDENLQPVLEQNILLTRLVEDLRTLAQADSGQLQLEKIPTNFLSLVERILDRFKPQAEVRNIKLQFSSQGECQPLNLDPGRMEQILGNLISNAIRYTPDDGWIKVILECSPERATLSIQDSGPGIPDESLPHIFERFYRADQSRSRIKGGTGLGLAIARQLTEAHGGILTAANNPDGGALFKLTLPCGVGGSNHDNG